MIDTERVISEACPACGYRGADSADALVCSMCGALRQREHAPPQPASRDERVEAAPVAVSPASSHPSSPGAGVDVRTPLLLCGAGVLLAPLFGLTPLLRYMAWFLTSLTHEMGHCAAAWFCGCPAYPAIRLDGHAAAMHAEQMIVLAGVIWFALGAAAWHQRGDRWRGLGLGAATLLYPAVAFTGLRELVFLLAGHGGEIAFAMVFLWRALAGGFSHSMAERVAYSTLGWLLVGRNVILSLRLVLSPQGRADYASSGSFGLTNDYLRVADDVFGGPLELVAAPMGLLAVALPVATVLVWWSGRRPDDRP
ncbi:MAG: hypothetical protein AAF628_33015 [Planctomycetota bacterium]